MIINYIVLACIRLCLFSATRSGSAKRKSSDQASGEEDGIGDVEDVTSSLDLRFIGREYVRHGQRLGSHSGLDLGRIAYSYASVLVKDLPLTATLASVRD